MTAFAPISDDMKNRVLWITVLLLIIYLSIAQGKITSFLFWNASPIIVCGLLLSLSKLDPSKPSFWGGVGFALTGGILTLLLHTAWLFDWGEFATGSSTSALIFIFIPIYAFIIGGISWILGWYIGKYYINE